MQDPMPTDIFKAGQVLNNTYEVIGVLGRGGTGECRTNREADGTFLCSDRCRAPWVFSG